MSKSQLSVVVNKHKGSSFSISGLLMPNIIFRLNSNFFILSIYTIKIRLLKKSRFKTHLDLVSLYDMARNSYYLYFIAKVTEKRNLREKK